jgi:lysophospholipase L1-like esterase
MAVDKKDEITTESRLSNFGKNILLLLISLVLVWGICEVVLRIYNPLGFRIKGDKIILPVNRKEIIHHEPGKLDAIVIHQSNSLGFRGPEPPADFADYLTVVTVGGSTTECFELAEDKTWPHVLGEKLKKDFNRLWLDNAGLSGNSTFGNYVLMRDFMVKLRPKVVVFLEGINDIGISGARDFDARIKEFNFRSLERFLASMAVRSELAAAMLNLYRFYFPKSVMTVNQNDPKEIDLKRLPTLEVSPEAKAAIIQAHKEKYLRPYETRLKRLLDISTAHHMQPALLTQPVLYGNVIDDVTGVNLGKVKVTKEMNGEVAWEVLELYNGVTRKVGREAGVPVIDLATELPKTSRYFYDPMHYTNQGAEQVGEIVYRHLSPWLAKNYPGYRRAAP